MAFHVKKYLFARTEERIHSKIGKDMIGESPSSQAKEAPTSRDPNVSKPSDDSQVPPQDQSTTATGSSSDSGAQGPFATVPSMMPLIEVVPLAIIPHIAPEVSPSHHSILFIAL